MITKSSNLVIVEGTLVPADGAGELARGRVEIDVATGMIVETGEARGTGDLVLDDEHIILAGIIDQHVHAREDPSGEEVYKESFQTAGEAAVFSPSSIWLTSLPVLTSMTRSRPSQPATKVLPSLIAGLQ